jgi:catechol 2,3-dioxygenase-like lactoylglutathione lyase family enzyme
MIQARRLGHATFECTDLDRDIDYYQETIGLSLVAREAGRAFLASGCGELAIALEKGAQDACTALAFEVAPTRSGASIMAAAAADGLAPATRSDAAPGVAEIVAFADPKGTRIELYPRRELTAGNVATGGVRPNKLGHIAFRATDPDALSAFYARTLGFRISDWIEDWFVFMRCNPEHHTVNFIRGPVNRVHHFAFELRDASHMIAACDLLARHKRDILWGPTRQGPGHNVAVYHRNPAGQLVELFFDLDVMPDEELGYYEPRPWHRDRPQRPKVWDGPLRQIWGLPPSPEFHADTA